MGKILIGLIIAGLIIGSIFGCIGNLGDKQASDAISNTMTPTVETEIDLYTTPSESPEASIIPVTTPAASPMRTNNYILMLTPTAIASGGAPIVSPVTPTIAPGVSPTSTPSATKTKSPAPTSGTQTPASSPVTDTINSKSALIQFLAANFGTCRTSLGNTRFTFEVDEKSSPNHLFDYWLKVRYDSQFFIDLQFSETVTDGMNQRVCDELRDHQEELALAAISKMPGKKFQGGYYNLWYRTPESKVDPIVKIYYSWANYSQVTSPEATYEDAQIIDFTWLPDMDDILTR
jgi:hypothetical protein